MLAELRAGAASAPRLLAGDDKNSVLVEMSQDAIKAIAYSAYGHRMDDPTMSSPLGYNGERRETQTGWYMLGNGYRVFNPLLMRFHSPDSLSPFGKGGLNAYTYCVGDPINSVDPTGHISWGSFLRKFRPTTASPIAKSIPRSFTTNPYENTKAASLKTIRPQHVESFKKIQQLRAEDAIATKKEIDRLMSNGASSVKMAAAIEDYENLIVIANSAAQDYLFAARNQGKKAITRYSVKTIETEAVKYDLRRAVEELAALREFKEQAAKEIQEMQATIRGTHGAR
ncbi:RHS repeat-associated core domain-containing protein [Pseudomonas sp. NFACC48-1]|nr:RHS repeat-associated core domain-containing protein [Pseudomonas sp. NFACC44-2]SDA87562.1 RHS repeat-associated core domain-containing protein [Pseudomonas sp. NFACC51]SFH86495.1 RHS repeat-associated core domain-containing protein [Pseudomonas sp. NFACC54]SFS49223.1 RHS repeat-associated core domain-containing protein [Pseudomonas sp. NFACC48-1]